MNTFKEMNVKQHIRCFKTITYISYLVNTRKYKAFSNSDKNIFKEKNRNGEGKVRLGFLGGSQLTGNKGIKNPNTERKFGARHLTPPTIHILVQSYIYKSIPYRLLIS